MIELISVSRCTSCNICVQVCPVNVFDAKPSGPPVIARQDDCQTCFMCEVYCPADALFVAPHADQTTPVLEEDLVSQGLLGSYREAIGWTPSSRHKRQRNASYEVLRQMR